MNEIPLREVTTRVRDYKPEAAFAFMDLADSALQLACIERNPTGAAELLKRIAAEVGQTTFVNLGVKTVGTSRRGRRKDKVVKPSDMTIAEIGFGGIKVGDFFSRSLGIEEIITYLLARGVVRKSYADVFGGLIPGLLCTPVERTDVSSQDLSEAQILFENITRFREWILESFIDGDIETLCRILPAFAIEEVQRLGMFVGEQFVNDPEVVLPLLKSMSSIPALQRSGKQIWDMSYQIQKVIFKQNPNYIPFGRAIAERAMIESLRSEEVLAIAFSEIDREFADRYGEIFKMINSVRFLEVSAGESLFLRRLGIERIRFKIDRAYDLENITIEIECEDGFVLELALMEPCKRESGWVEAYTELTGLSTQRIYELAAYLEGYLLDIDRLVNTVKKTEDKAAGKLKNAFRKKKKRRDVRIESLTIARSLLARAGFINPLLVDNQSLRFPIPREDLWDEGVIDERRYIIDHISDPFDFIDPETAEVFRFYAQGSFYRTLTYEDMSPEEVLARYPQAMVYDITQDTLDEGWEQRILFNGLSKTNDWQKLLTILGNVSYVGALEYILLQQL